MSNFKTQVETFSVNRAVEALKVNKANRPLSKHTVSTYAKAIERGEWLLNGEAICFDEKGNLVNGQHRCHAIIMCKKPIQTVVVYGAQDGSFKTYDTGKRRGGADAMALEGYKNHITLAAAARALLMLDSGASWKSFTNTQLLDAVKEHPAIGYWVREFITSKAKHFMTSLFPGVLTIASERHGSELMNEFLSRVASGTNLSAGDPALVLRERFINRTRGRQFHVDVALGFCIKAVNAEILGNRIQVLRMSPDETFPILV